MNGGKEAQNVAMVSTKADPRVCVASFGSRLDSSVVTTLKLLDENKLHHELVYQLKAQQLPDVASIFALPPLYLICEPLSTC
jgi:hypothetical protein